MGKAAADETNPFYLPFFLRCVVAFVCLFGGLNIIIDRVYQLFSIYCNIKWNRAFPCGTRKLDQRFCCSFLDGHETKRGAVERGRIEKGFS